jgi:hypothetical protein
MCLGKVCVWIEAPVQADYGGHPLVGVQLQHKLPLGAGAPHLSASHISKLFEITSDNPTYFESESVNMYCTVCYGAGAASFLLLESESHQNVLILEFCTIL